MFIKIQLCFSFTRPRVPCIFDQIIIVIKGKSSPHNLAADVNYAFLPALADNFLHFLCNFKENFVFPFSVAQRNIPNLRLNSFLLLFFFHLLRRRIKCNVAQISIYYHGCSVFLRACTSIIVMCHLLSNHFH